MIPLVPMASLLASFHFLRPAWLLLLLPAAWVVWRLARRSNPKLAYRDEIAEHLLVHIVVAPRQRPKVRPLGVIAGLWLIGIIALAGPAWQRQPAAFGEETSGLMIVMKFSRSMEAGDLLPSRLERARLKVNDLLALRGGSPTGLIAYSGSAHQVMPMTTDGEIIGHMLEALSPDVMPEEGDRLADAVAMARDAIANSENRSGSILVIADAVSGEQLPQLEALRDGGLPGTQFLAIAADRSTLEPSGLAGAAKALGSTISVIEADDSDVQAIQRRSESALAFGTGEDELWRDEGIVLLPLLALGMLFWARRGWSIQQPHAG